MKVLCVQCLKLNDLADDTPPGEDGKTRFPCPHCAFVTVVTRKKAKAAPVSAPPPSPAAAKPAAKPAPAAVQPRDKRPNAGDDDRPTAKNPPAASLADELFDGSEKDVGDWMVRRLDGTEAGPLTFEELKQMIQDGDIGKIDEVRRMEERYVPAAFHELTAELFNELDMAGMSPPKRG